LTGQAQGWSLFAPDFPPRSALPQVVLRWPDGREAVRACVYEPADPDHYFRLPDSSCRLFNVEFRMALVYWSFDDDTYAKRTEDWRKAVLGRPARQRRSM
jgi:hypothetical protein